jgi:hypothetical protein
MKKEKVEALQLDAVTGGLPQTTAKAVAESWRWGHWVDHNPHVKPSETLTQFRQLKDTITRGFIFQAMAEWDPDMLIELAREMKKAPLESFQPNKADWTLLEISKQGKVNLSELEREARKRKLYFADLKTWRRHAQALNIQCNKPGEK